MDERGVRRGPKVRRGVKVEDSGVCDRKSKDAGCEAARGVS